jgi:hypothetical protein
MSCDEAQEPASFQRDILPLFRQSDRDEMLWAFDLFDWSDVARHAGEIAKRLGEGSMPCDGVWVSERLDGLRQWIECGMRP